VLFVLVHLFEVAITGLRNNVRSIITGRYEIVESQSAPRAEGDQP
jgi:hypothetical protein